jgi:hypothetical protein
MKAPFTLADCTVTEGTDGVTVRLPSGDALFLSNDALQFLAFHLRGNEAEPEWAVELTADGELRPVDDLCPVCGDTTFDYGDERLCPTCTAYDLTDNSVNGDGQKGGAQ